MNRKLSIFLFIPLLIGAALAAGLIGGKHLSDSSNDTFSGQSRSAYNKIQDILNYIDKEYVDSVDRNDLTDEAVIALLKDLDPHSVYIPAEEFDQMNDPLLGKFEGIGVQFTMQEDTIMVLHVIAGGPSEKAGLKDGDRIVEVEGEVVAGKKLSTLDVMRYLKGDKGTKVEVNVKRRGFPDLIPFTIVRDVIPTSSIDISFLPEENVGYIRLSRFSMTTAGEFRDALEELREDGMEKLILDLRGNSGGFLDAAISLADELLPDDKLIVYTEGRARPRRFFYATGEGSFETQPLIILIDEGSASASEILAGAIQDNDRGLIVGRRSFGKGLVQEQLNLPDGSGVRLTVARYYSPTGRCIQRPYEEGTDAYHEDFMARFHSGQMMSPDSIDFPDSLKYTTPGGKIVYGGGGIMPDVFIPVEKDERFGYYNLLVNRGLIYQFAFNYSDRHRPELLEYGDAETFATVFRVDEEMMEDLIRFAEEEGVDTDEEGESFAREKIRSLMKAYIARNIFGDEGFYPLYLEIDRTYQKALDLIHQNGITADFVREGRNQG